MRRLTTAPNLAIWNEDGFIVENEGVPPDVEWGIDDVIAAFQDPEKSRPIFEEAANCLAIWHLGLIQCHFDVVPLLETADDDFDMLLNC